MLATFDTETRGPQTLDCGHEVTPQKPDSILTGYATRPDGSKICYACADDEQRKALLTEQTCFAYLTVQPSGDLKQITTWTGGQLMRVTRISTSKMRGFGGVPYQRVYIRAIDVHGQKWHGTSPGFGMYARLRRSK